MVDTLTVGNVVFGEGIPKICVPITGENEEEIISQTVAAVKAAPDCIELRMDWFSGVADTEQVRHVLGEVRKAAGDCLVLFTFRSKKEGGQREISEAEYRILCETACESGCIDLLDVEAYRSAGGLAALADVAHGNGVYVIGSSHDFEGTPKRQILSERLHEIDEMGADIPKLAVMPTRVGDVLDLLSATQDYYETGGVKPVVTMSMGKLGYISRIAGELVGSAMTFATVGQASAPGQIPIEQVRNTMQMIHF